MNQSDLLRELDTLRGRVAELEDAQLRLTHTEQALRESEERFRLLYENAPLGYQSLDTNGNLIEVNRAWLEALGYTREEVIGRWVGDFLAPEYVEHFKQNFPRFKAAGEIHWVEFDMVKKNGARVSVAFDGQISRDQWGRFKQTHCIMHDITELKKSQGALKETEEKYRRIVETANDGICAVDRNLRITFVNQRLADMLGYSVEEALGVRADAFIFAEDLEDHESKMGVRTQGEHQVYERRIRHKDGRILWANVSATALKDSDGSFVGSFAMLTDITERKQAEEDLRGSEEKFAKAFRRAPVLMTLSHVDDGTYLDVNDEFCEVSGFSREETIGKTSTELGWISAEDREHLIAEMQAHGRVSGMELRLVAKDERQVYCIYCGELIQSRDRRLLLSIALDITERKRAEEALRESETMLKESQRVAALGHYDVNVISGVWTSSEALDAVFGIGSGYTRNVDGWLSIVLPESRGEMLAYLRDHVLRDRNSFDKEYRILRISDGAERWVHGRGNLETNADGHLTRMFGTIQDVTERKRAEEWLRESEEKYKDLFDNSTDLIYTHDLDGNYTSVNKAVTGLLGYSPDEFLRLNFRQIVDPGHRRASEENLRKKAEGEVSKTWPYEVLVRTKEGHPVWLEVNSRIMLLDGVPVGVHGNGRDITSRKESEAERSRLATAIEQAAEEVLITDPGGAIVYANPAFEQITGYSPKEAMGKNPRFLQSGHHEPSFYREMWDTITDGRVWNGHLINKRKDGKLIEEEATISPVKDELGRIVNFVAVKRDVTNEVILQRQLLEAQKMESIGTLAGGIAHDFNNLLQVINGYAEIALFDIQDGDPGYSALREIRRAGRSAAELTQGLLTFSRRVESKLRPVDLNRELHHVAKMLTRTLPKMIEIRMDLSEHLETVNADPAQMQQVVMNLAVNARDAMPDGGRIIIASRNVYLDEEYGKKHLGTAAGHYVLLSVSDNGVGMDDQTRKHIFDPFFTTKETGKGTGLGLAIVFGIVKSHGGNILCYSEPGQGATFKIYLPSLRAAHDVMETGQFTAFVGGDETLLVVDDEDAVRKLATQLLEKFGYSVLTATNGKDGVEVFSRERNRIDLVVLDLIMPEMGGIDCLRELLKISPEAKVIIASGYAANGQIDQALENGAKASVRKPFETRQLLELIRRVLDEE